MSQLSIMLVRTKQSPEKAKKFLFLIMVIAPSTHNTVHAARFKREEQVNKENFAWQGSAATLGTHWFT